MFSLNSTFMCIRINFVHYTHSFNVLDEMFIELTMAQSKVLFYFIKFSLHNTTLKTRNQIERPTCYVVVKQLIPANFLFLLVSTDLKTRTDNDDISYLILGMRYDAFISRQEATLTYEISFADCQFVYDCSFQNGKFDILCWPWTDKLECLPGLKMVCLYLMLLCRKVDDDFGKIDIFVNCFNLNSCSIKWRIKVIVS